MSDTHNLERRLAGTRRSRIGAAAYRSEKRKQGKGCRNAWEQACDHRHSRKMKVMA